MIIDRMHNQIQAWETARDDRALFLGCYRMMTGNMLAAIDAGAFHDAAWVDRLLHRFADYYFDALADYERAPASSPRVWQAAHGVCCDAGVWPLQKILLGINAHINYDLVLTLRDLLDPEWPVLTRGQRAERYADHCRVNAVIARTIDAVQDRILEPAMPAMDYLDKLLGPVDEFLISALITRWREAVWANAMQLLALQSESDRRRFTSEIEEETLEKAGTICRKFL